MAECACSSMILTSILITEVYILLPRRDNGILVDGETREGTDCLGMVKGTVEKFDAKRGFGFIKPDNGGEQVFVHWEAISTDDRWPKLEKGEKVAFATETDENGKVRRSKRLYSTFYSLTEKIPESNY